MNELEAKTLLKVISAAIPEMQPIDHSWEEIRGWHERFLCFAKVKESPEGFVVYTGALTNVDGYSLNSKLAKSLDDYKARVLTEGTYISGLPTVILSIADLEKHKKKILVSLWYMLWDFYKDDADYAKHFDFVIDRNVELNIDINGMLD